MQLFIFSLSQSWSFILDCYCSVAKERLPSIPWVCLFFYNLQHLKHQLIQNVKSISPNPCPTELVRQYFIC